eukprot:TRINITY_DN3658_c0_g1_i9.p1 TRINITY_DN3658_c0_g1~~TRINITY_DN3658_c0_g1_i9.p1  ORF type:complete len:156 (-),score=24.98 TRINITY_DN3658_c0_g1_i9:46-513(-)
MAFLFFCETLQMWRHVVLVLLWIAGHSVHVPSWQEIVPVAPRSDAVELPAEGTWFHDSADLAAGQDLNLAEMSANVADNMRTPRGWRMRKKRKKKRRRELINEIVKSGKPVSPKEQARLQAIRCFPFWKCFLSRNTRNDEFVIVSMLSVLAVVLS